MKVAALIILPTPSRPDTPWPPLTYQQRLNILVELLRPCGPNFA